MSVTRFMAIAFVCTAAGVSTTACSKSAKKTTPPAEVQSQTPVQQTNAPVTVTGCVKAGEAADTFVLTTARSTEGEQTATYQLRGAENNQLRDQIGKRVEVSGVVTAQQRTESLSTTDTTQQAKGTSGKPTVSTQTDVDMRQLDVQSIRPLGARCDM